MTNIELFEEIKETRKDVKQLHKDFYIFKGKAYGFIALLSVVTNVVIALLLKVK